MFIQLRYFLKLARLQFLLGSGIFYVIGVLMALHQTGLLDIMALLLGLATMWLLQLSTHFLNEYYDQVGDYSNRHRTFFSGGSGVLAEGRLAPQVARLAAFIAFSLAVLLLATATLTLSTFGLTTLVIFSIAAIGALGYSAPPLSLVERGLGELYVTLIVGLLVPLFGYSAQTGKTNLMFALACLPCASLILASVISVAFPDFKSDRKTLKQTLVVILGPEKAAKLYAGLLTAGYIMSWFITPLGIPITVVLSQAATMPIAALSLFELKRGGYKIPQRYSRNTLLGVGVVATAGFGQIAGFLLAIASK